jgi:hypothetical protein
VAAAQGNAKIPQLQSVHAVAFPAGALVHLHPFTTLTSLRLQAISYKRNMASNRPPVPGYWFLRPAPVVNNYFTSKEVCTALARLPSLRCLAVNTEEDDLLPATSSLTNLTSLSFEYEYCAGDVPTLRHPPPQLQEFTMSVNSSRGMRPSFNHVTGLTRLMLQSVDINFQDGWVVGSGLLSRGVVDKLPPNCRHLSVDGLVSAEPLLELQHLERLAIQECNLGSVSVQYALQQLSSLSTLTDLQVNIRAADLNEGTADVLLSLPSLRGLRLGNEGLGYHHHRSVVPVLRKLLNLSALQRLSMACLMLPNSSEFRLADAVCGMRGLQSLCLDGCKIGIGYWQHFDSSVEYQEFVRAIAGLPALRDLRLAYLEDWDHTALAEFAAATQLTGLMVISDRASSELVSLVGQVHKLSRLRRLWMDSPGMDRFDIDAAAANLTGLTELCLRACDPQLVGAKFPGAFLGNILSAADDMWFNSFRDGPLKRSAWKLKWWSPAEGDLICK